MTSPYAKTLLQVVSDTQRLCNDFIATGKDGDTWAWAEMRTAVQDTLLDMVRRTGILRETRVIFLEEDGQVYDLPGDCIRLLRVGINKITGSVVLPTSISARDYAGLSRSAEGDPTGFYRDHTLGPNQIGFVPTPGQDGSTFTRDTAHGLLRRVTDSDGNELEYDANEALRRIRGVPATMSGDGHIIRDLVSLFGNIQVNYVRAPEKWERPDTYPEDDILPYIHKDLKYGAATRILKSSKKRLLNMKQGRFTVKWERVLGKLQRHAETMGLNDSARAV